MTRSNKGVLSLAAVMLMASTGCTISGNVERKVAEIDLQKAEIERIERTESKYSRVVLNKHFYVPPIKAEAVDLPGWYSKKVTFRHVSVPFAMVVQEATKNHPVTVNFSDLEAEDLKTPISLEVKDEELGSALKRIANQAGYALTYSKGRAVYSKYETRRFSLSALPGKQSGKIGRDSEASQQSNATGSLSGLSSSMTNSSTKQYAGIKIEDVSAVEDVKSAIEAVLSEKGTVSVTDMGMSAVVKDYPYNVAQAKKVVDHYNEEFSKQVEVQVSLIDVIMTEDDRLGLDYKALLKAFDSRVEIDFGGAFTTGGNGTLSPSQFALKVLTGDLAGTEVLAEALAQQGAVSRTVFQKIVTTNGTIGTSKAVTRENYIAEQYGNGATTGGFITSGGTRQETLETGQVLNVLPRIFEDDVILKMNSSLSANLGITEKVNEDTGTYVESPRVADMEFDQTVIVPHGYTLVIGGMKVDSMLTQLSNAGYDVLGFSKSGTSERKETLLTITVKITRGKKRSS